MCKRANKKPISNKNKQTRKFLLHEYKLCALIKKKSNMIELHVKVKCILNCTNFLKIEHKLNFTIFSLFMCKRFYCLNVHKIYFNHLNFCFF